MRAGSVVGGPPVACQTGLGAELFLAARHREDVLESLLGLVTLTTHRRGGRGRSVGTHLTSHRGKHSGNGTDIKTILITSTLEND